MIRLALALAVLLTSCAAIDNLFGGPDDRPIPPYVNENASPAAPNLFGAHRLDAGEDG
jgi:hypothetical protein